jgi:hypothetical protein
MWEALVQSQIRFNRNPEKILDKVPRGFGAKPGQVQQGSGEGLGGFGVTGFRRRFWRRFREALVRSQVWFNRVRRGFGAEPGEVYQDLRSFDSRKPGCGVFSAWLRTLQKDL